MVDYHRVPDVRKALPESNGPQGFPGYGDRNPFTLPGDLVWSEDRSVGADAKVTAFAIGDGAAEAGADAAGHGRLEGEMGRYSSLFRDGGDGFEHRHGSAGVDRRVGVFEHLWEKLGNVTRVAVGAIVRRGADVGFEAAEVIEADEVIGGRGADKGDDLDLRRLL